MFHCLAKSVNAKVLTISVRLVMHLKQSVSTVEDLIIERSVIAVHSVLAVTKRILRLAKRVFIIC